MDQWKEDVHKKASFPEIETANAILEDLFDSYTKLYPIESYYHKIEGYM